MRFFLFGISGIICLVAAVILYGYLTNPWVLDVAVLNWGVFGLYALVVPPVAGLAGSLWAMSALFERKING